MPDSTILIDYMLAKITDLIKDLIVYPDRMRRNLELTGGLIYSQRLLLALVDKGAQRKESYEAVQRNAMASWRGGGGLQELAAKDPFISQHLKKHEIAACFNPKYYLRHLDQIYRRVFGRGKSRSFGTGKKGTRS
jgi:adenylosuccinate lyase